MFAGRSGVHALESSAANSSSRNAVSRSMHPVTSDEIRSAMRARRLANTRDHSVKDLDEMLRSRWSAAITVDNFIGQGERVALIKGSNILDRFTGRCVHHRIAPSVHAEIRSIVARPLCF
jgi:hypothetical protein